MNTKLPEKAVEYFKKHKIKSEDACWQLTKGAKKVWLIKHDYLELIAVEEGISITEYTMQWGELGSQAYANGDVAITVKAENKNGVSVITTGEANKKNCFMPYPIAMAEKRAVDRAYLKLLNIKGIYSAEDEAYFKKDGFTKDGAKISAVPEQYDFKKDKEV